jgi:hypothetical protein
MEFKPQRLKGPLPVLSVKKPWIDLIGGGFKDIEIRGKRRPAKTDGKLVLLHASMNPSDDYQHVATREAQGFPLEPDLNPPGHICYAVRFGENIIYHTLEEFRKDRPRHLCGDIAFRPRVVGWPIVQIVETTRTPFRGMPGMPSFPYDIFTLRPFTGSRSNVLKTGHYETAQEIEITGLEVDPESSYYTPGDRV